MPAVPRTPDAPNASGTPCVSGVQRAPEATSPSGTPRVSGALVTTGAPRTPAVSGTPGAPRASVAPRAPDAPNASGAAEATDVWLRTNFRGRRVTLRQGPALACGVCAAVLLVPGPGPRVRAASVLAAAGAAAFGVYDDLAGSSRARGLRGHLGALAGGRITTGMVKMAGIGATGVAAARLLRRSPLDTVLDGALIAASANLLNLFDLRPGRAARRAIRLALDFAATRQVSGGLLIEKQAIQHKLADMATDFYA
ncbi:acyl-CoA dehydrogenase family protein, partial [Nocardiopsis dassonvillei]|uniref:acyl-CoA dehydrogenase family protein n=1 Tax=Nocardiopsis dassonvillei TaxID=2014 RepID=UPI0035E3E4C1